MPSSEPTEFCPVVPDIPDETLKYNEDPDIEIIKQREYRRRSSKQQNNQIPQNEQKKPQQKNPQKSIGRSIVIGVLVVVITVLVILLIYYLYLYCTEEENPLEKRSNYSSRYGGVGDGYQYNRYDEEKYGDRNQRSKNINPTPPVEDQPKKANIPDHVKKMDDDELSRYIKKDASKNVKQTRDITQQTMEGDTVDHESDRKEIDEILDKMSNKENTPEMENVPSREDTASALKNDLLREKKEKEKLGTILEYQDELEDFEFEDGVKIELLSDNNDDDTVPALESMDTMDGCPHILKKGKRKGQSCNRPTSSGKLCSNHV